MNNKKGFAGILVLLFLYATPGFAQAAAEKKSLPIPEDLVKKVEQSAQLGLALYQIDQASAIGTDVLRAKYGNSVFEGLGGYLTFRETNEAGEPSWLVIFYTRESTPQILHKIHIPFNGDSPEVETLDPPQLARGQTLILILARKNAINNAGPYRQSINPVLLPADIIGEEGILVELLASTTKPNVAVLGKHYRVIVSEDGKEVRSITPLSNGILEIPTTSEKLVEVHGLYATHLVTDYPVETHVFASLLHKIPIHVKTSRGIWLVDGIKITMVPEEEYPQNRIKSENPEQE